MKAWGDQPPPGRRPRRARLQSPEGPGLRRLDGTVLVPELAVLGRDVFELSVLEHPTIGEWWGEDPDYPGSGLIAIDRVAAIPATPAAREMLEGAASVARQMRSDLEQRTSDELRTRHLAGARAIAAALPRPGPADLAIDLGHAVSGRIPEPARWWRTRGGVRLETARSDDDPLGWVEDWASAEDLLVADGVEARAAAEDLVAASRADDRERALRIDGTVREAAARHLAAIAPDLAAGLSSEVEPWMAREADGRPRWP